MLLRDTIKLLKLYLFIVLKEIIFLLREKIRDDDDFGEINNGKRFM